MSEVRADAVLAYENPSMNFLDDDTPTHSAKPNCDGDVNSDAHMTSWVRAAHRPVPPIDLSSFSVNSDDPEEDKTVKKEHPMVTKKVHKL